MNPVEPIDNIPIEQLQANLCRIQGELLRNRYRDEPPAKLIAVTKNTTVSVTNLFAQLGQWDIAENRAQVLLNKVPELNTSFRIHWIGRLQSNKIKSIIPQVTLVHSLDHMSVAQEIDRRASELGRVVPVLVQVNISGEKQKGGIPVADTGSFIRSLDGFSGLQVKGLMSIMPLDAPEENLRSWFRGMRTLYERLRCESYQHAEITELSMGMSRDYLIAAQEGATMVRIGSALFSRNDHQTAGGTSI